MKTAQRPVLIVQILETTTYQHKRLDLVHTQCCSGLARLASLKDKAGPPKSYLLAPYSQHFSAQEVAAMIAILLVITAQG
jgi:hypothetical protein